MKALVIFNALFAAITMTALVRSYATGRLTFRLADTPPLIVRIWSIAAMAFGWLAAALEFVWYFRTLHQTPPSGPFEVHGVPLMLLAGSMFMLSQWPIILYAWFRSRCALAAK